MTISRAFLLCLIGATFTFAADGPLTTSLELQGNVAFVKASIAGSEPLDMVLDSGTIYTTLDETVASKLGLDLSMKAQSSGARGTQEVSVIKSLTLRFCGLENTEPMGLAYPLEFVSKRIGRHVDGIIGVEFLHRYVVEIDYPGRQVRVWPQDTFTYTGTGEAVPVTYERRLPIIVGAITPFGREPIPARLQVDSGGAAASAMLWKAFIEKHDIAAGARDVKEVQITGFTGTTTQKQGRLEALTIGKIVIAEPEMGLANFQFGDANLLDGNLGSGFLKQFRVIFDLPHDRIILERPAPKAGTIG